MRERTAKMVVDRGSVRDLERPFRHRSGAQRLATVSAELIELDGDTCILTVVEDITDRKRAEDQVRESSERLQLAMQAARMGTWEWEIQQDRVEAALRIAAKYGAVTVLKGCGTVVADPLGHSLIEGVEMADGD